MNPAETLHRLKFLHDQIHQTVERSRHLPSAMPLDVQPESLNYQEDVTRLKQEYRHAVDVAMVKGELSPADLAKEGLPHSI